MFLNLVFNGQIVGKAEVGGWLTLPNGDKISPALAGWSANGYSLVPDSEIPAYTFDTAELREAQINSERDRRLAQPFPFAGKMIDADATTLQRISGMASLAGLSIILFGVQPSDLRWTGEDGDFVWITADNSLLPLDAFQMLELGKAAAMHVKSIIFAAKTLKDMAEFPADFTNDSYWTS